MGMSIGKVEQNAKDLSYSNQATQVGFPFDFLSTLTTI
jgi:hypothetical protein